MIKTIVRRTALAVALIALTAPASRMYAGTSTPPTVVTGGDPQPTGEVILRTIVVLRSIVVM